MVRQLRQKRIIKPPEAYKYRSRYGSHAEMIDEEETKKLDDENKVVLHDEHGYYTTEKSRVDSGLADPNRYDSSRLIWYRKQDGSNVS